MAAPGDQQTARFRALALPLLGYLHRLALALTTNRTRADDLVQETFLRALRYFDSYQGEDFKAWMAAIMRNIHRSKTPPAPLSTDDEWLTALPDPAPNPEQTAATAERAQRLRGLLAGLPEALREVLVLREYGDLSYAQIASTLSIPTGTVMSRLARARDDLRKAWLAAHDGRLT
jgi:RNA polymerase sigma-70 factor (ECF subfamily)